MSPLADPTGDPRLSPGEAAPSIDSLGPQRPAVARAGGGSAPWFGIGAMAVLGLVVFLWMSSHRVQPPRDLAAQAGPAAQVASPPPPPPELAAMENAARGQALAAPPPAPVVAAPAPPPSLHRDDTPPPPPAQHTPVLVVDLADQPAAAPASGAKPGGGPPGAPAALSPEEQFASRVESGGEPDRARATNLRDKSAVIAQGAMIPAVLETALDSDLPGFARAVVARDVRSFDGLSVLIPRGSRLIGEYRTASSQGQSRAFVIWTRVLRPDGVSVQIGSPATDPLGRAGLAGSVDHHFFERFGGAILLSVVNAGATALAGSPSTQVVIGSPQDATGVAAAVSAFAPVNINPTIKVPQGAPIRIFVARDLDFTPVGSTSR
jgi:type IV secretion system protein VirB10